MQILSTLLTWSHIEYFVILIGDGLINGPTDHRLWRIPYLHTWIAYTIKAHTMISHIFRHAIYSFRYRYQNQLIIGTSVRLRSECSRIDIQLSRSTVHCVSRHIQTRRDDKPLLYFHFHTIIEKYADYHYFSIGPGRVEYAFTRREHIAIVPAWTYVHTTHSQSHGHTHAVHSARAE